MISPPFQPQIFANPWLPATKMLNLKPGDYQLRSHQEGETTGSTENGTDLNGPKPE